MRTMPDGLPAIMRAHELYTALSPITEKLPALKRQTIGRRLEDSTLQLLELLPGNARQQQRFVTGD